MLDHNWLVRVFSFIALGRLPDHGRVFVPVLPCQRQQTELTWLVIPDVVEFRFMKSRLATWLHDYKKWKKVCHHEFLFHDLSDVEGRELTCLEDLSALLGLTGVIDPRVLSNKIQALPVPKYGTGVSYSPAWCCVPPCCTQHLKSYSYAACRLLQVHLIQ